MRVDGDRMDVGRRHDREKAVVSTLAVQPQVKVLYAPVVEQTVVEIGVVRKEPGVALMRVYVLPLLEFLDERVETGLGLGRASEVLSPVHLARHRADEP